MKATQHDVDRMHQISLFKMRSFENQQGLYAKMLVSNCSLSCEELSSLYTFQSYERQLRETKKAMKALENETELLKLELQSR